MKISLLKASHNQVFFFFFFFFNFAKIFEIPLFSMLIIINIPVMNYIEWQTWFLRLSTRLVDTELRCGSSLRHITTHVFQIFKKMFVQQLTEEATSNIYIYIYIYIYISYIYMMGSPVDFYS